MLDAGAQRGRQPVPMDVPITLQVPHEAPLLEFWKSPPYVRRERAHERHHLAPITAEVQDLARQLTGGRRNLADGRGAG
jgi:hypothetical protein